jgi:hypothetical protein
MRYCISLMVVISIFHYVSCCSFCGTHFNLRTPFQTITCLQVDSSSEVLSSVDSVVTEFLLDTEDLVELGQALRSGWRTSLDLSSTETNNDVGNGDILGLTGAVRNHDAPASTEGILGSLDSLSDCADLVDLQQKCVTRLKLDGLLDELGVGDSQIVTKTGLAGARYEHS